jgi:hypothetical protein
MSVKVLPALQLLRPTAMERHSSEPPNSLNTLFSTSPTSPASAALRSSTSPVAPSKRQVVVVLGGSFSGTTSPVLLQTFWDR